jgi:ppGpp synthetase/RelA/SpoT-type nucleotidyltranferase
MTMLEQLYRERHQNVLCPLADKLESLLRDHFPQRPPIDRVCARAKSPERFLAKALKDAGGKPKYSDPINQIQDQIGARITVFYTTDVLAISSQVERYFRPIESRLLVPDSDTEFGYVGKHYILILPPDVFDATITESVAPRFFELQIKTLFQHAWSEANHDLGYKPGTELTSDQRRKIAFTAAQAWGADLIFGELHRELTCNGGAATITGDTRASTAAVAIPRV